MFGTLSHRILLVACISACGGAQDRASTAANEPNAETSEPSAPSSSSEPAPSLAPAATPSADPASSDTTAAVSNATSAAETWLQLVDQGRYDDSWKASSSLFRGAVTSEGWSKAVGGVRGQLGKLLSRRVASAEYQSTLPGAPDGKYVVIVYDASYEHKASAVETVTPMEDSDGAWRVSGYFVR